MEPGFLNVSGEKMSKSLGKFITIPELLEKYNSGDFRYFIASLHYRSRIDFNDKAIGEAKINREKWNNLIQELLSIDGTDNKKVEKLVKDTKEAFTKAMDEDFNLPNAWAVLYDFQSKINTLIASQNLSKNNAKKVLGFLKELNKIFSVFDFEKQKNNISKELEALIEKREEFRKAKKFAESDKIRDKLKEKGIELMDTLDGVKWKQI